MLTAPHAHSHHGALPVFPISGCVEFMQHYCMHGCWETVEMFAMVCWEFHILSLWGINYEKGRRTDKARRVSRPLLLPVQKIIWKREKCHYEWWWTFVAPLLRSITQRPIAPALVGRGAWSECQWRYIYICKKIKKNHKQMPVMSWAKQEGDARFMLKPTTVSISVCSFRKLPLCIMLHVLCC